MERAVESTKQSETKARGPAHSPVSTASSQQAHPMLQLQQQAGNAAVQQMLRSRVIQAKLAISHPDDPEEREADHVADRIMRSHAGGFPISAPCSCSAGGDMCDECEEKRASIHRHASSSGAPASIPRVVSNVLRSPGHPLDSSTRAFFEPRFSRDFSSVRVHTGIEAAASARSIQAHAYTAGSDIVFAQGQYSPGSTSGQRLLAHELAHVTQQTAAEASPRLQRKPTDDSNEAAWVLPQVVELDGKQVEIGPFNAVPEGISGPLPAGTVREDKGLTVTQSTDKHAIIEYGDCSIEITAEPGGTYSFYIDGALPRPEAPPTLPFFSMPDEEPKPLVQRVVRVSANSSSLVNVDYATRGSEKPALVLHQSYGGYQSTSPAFANGGVAEWWFSPTSVQLSLDNSVAKITTPSDDPSLRAEDYPDARFAYYIDPDWTGASNLEKRVFIIASPGVRLLEGEPNDLPAVDYGRKLVPIIVHVPHPDLVPAQGTVIRLENFVSNETLGYAPDTFGDDSPEKHSSALTVARGLSGVTIKHPWSGSRVSIRPADPSIGASYAWQVLATPGGPGEIRIVTSAGAFIEFVEPVPARFGTGGAGQKRPPLAGEFQVGEGLEEEGVTLRIVEVDDNSTIPVPGTPLNLDYYLSHGHLREPDVHEWADLDDSALKAMDFVIRLIPVAGQLYSIGEFIHAARFGEDLMGHKLPPGGLVLMGAGVIIGLIPEVGPALRGVGSLARLAGIVGKTVEEVEATVLTVGKLASAEDQAVLSRGAQILENGGEIADEELPEMESALSRVAPGTSLHGEFEAEAISFAADAGETFDNPEFAKQIAKEFQETGKVPPALAAAVERSGVKNIEEEKAIVQQFLRDASTDPASGIESSTVDEIVEKLPETTQDELAPFASAEGEELSPVIDSVPARPALDPLSNLESLPASDRVRILNQAMHDGDIDDILTRSQKTAKELLDAVGKTSPTGKRLQTFLIARAQKESTPLLAELGLDESAIVKIVSRPDLDKIKGQILEEVLESEVNKTLAADPTDAARQALLRGTESEGTPQFISASRITDVHKDGLSDGVLGILRTTEEGEKEIVAIRVFEDKAGKAARAQLSTKALRSKASRLAELSKADLTELENEAVQTLRDEQPAFRRSSSQELLRTQRPEIDRIIEANLPQNETGQAVKTSQRFAEDLSAKSEGNIPAEILVDGVRRKVRFPGAEQRVLVTGVLPAGLTPGRLSSTVARQGARLDIMNVRGVDVAGLSRLARVIAKAKGLL
jgi:hypothetical protein